LRIFILGLKVATSDGHDAQVGGVVDVAGYGDLLDDAFDMVGHDPSMFEIPTWLHSPNQVNTIARADFKHFENKNFVGVVTLARELIPLNVGPSADPS